MSTIPGLYVIGEANFSDHGANRLGASALMQGLADGYFILPYTIGDYLATSTFKPAQTTDAPFREVQQAVAATVKTMMSINGKKTAEEFHRELGKIMWDYVGMARNRTGLQRALQEIATLREEFWSNLKVVGSADDLNMELEKAGRVADFLELGELIAYDALHREESCGGHFREEYQTDEGEAKRNDEQFSYVAAWEFAGVGKPPMLHKEPLTFEYVKPSQRSYK
jgi:succinate dehydrogenase / fumarate reductase flavoprotein subunit